MPEDQSWLIGFRVVLGEPPDTAPLPPEPEARYRVGVAQRTPADLAQGPDPDRPYFEGPRQYVKIPPHSFGPMFSYHNHDPAIVETWNGDLLAIWYPCMTERSRELGLLASRLRLGEKEWEPASLFWDAPDRNDHTPALWFDGERTIHFFVGLAEKSSTLARKPFEDLTPDERLALDRQRAGELGDRLGLCTAGDYYENWGELGEKWLPGDHDLWYFITPKGELYRWSGRSNVLNWMHRTFQRTVLAHVRQFGVGFLP